MPVNPQTALNYESAPVEFSYDEDKVILYNLGIGWGSKPVDPTHLKFTYENGLEVFPTFGVVPSFIANMGAMGAPGMDVNPMMILHGEQYTEVLNPIPTAATLVSTGKITGISDKGTGAFIVIDVISSDKKSGKPIFKNTYGIFARGEGGFGGDGGPKPAYDTPSRAPDAVVETATLPQQALLYRLSGDKNPLHADPSFAAMGGFSTPILHGLCTYGIVGRAVFETYCGGDMKKFKSIKVRFVKPVFPSETIITRMWKDGNTVIVNAVVKRDGQDVEVVGNAAVILNG